MDRPHQNVALVAGVTGIVGASLAEILPRSSTGGGPWKVYGLARRPRPDWFADYEVEYVQCNLLDREETERTLSRLTDITHVFYVTWTARQSEQENCDANACMLNNTLNALLPNTKDLEYVCLQTGIKHYLGSHFNFDACTQISTYFENQPRVPGLNFYYVLEDILMEAVAQKKGDLTWSVHRPGYILGSSPSSLVNCVFAIAVYAAVCKHEGLPFVFTGTNVAWESHIEASDADLVAEQEIWAAITPEAKNEAFNISNGDTVSWKDVWPAIAENLGIQAAPYNGQVKSLVEMMKSKGPVWDEIVAKHSLYLTKLEDLMTVWLLLDIVLCKMPIGRSSMEKSGKHGFLGSRDTKDSFLGSLDRMRQKKFLPPA